MTRLCLDFPYMVKPEVDLRTYCVCACGGAPRGWKKQLQIKFLKIVLIREIEHDNDVLEVISRL